MKKALFLAIFLLPTITFGAFSTNLTIGNTGIEVTKLQQTLIENGCLNVAPTGYFGLLTQQGVECMMNKEVTKVDSTQEELLKVIKKLNRRISDLEDEIDELKESTKKVTLPAESQKECTSGPGACGA